MKKMLNFKYVDNKDQWGRYSYVGIDPKCEYILNKHVVTVKEKGSN